MKISVLLNNFNYARFLGRALASVLPQLAAEDELIVVDDGSSDHSVELLREWSARDARIKIILKKNGGQLSAFNAGFEQCAGDLICFLDADDEYCPGYLDRLRQVYQEQPQADFVFCRSEIIGGDHARPPWDVDTPGDWDFGVTYCQVCLNRRYLGGPTSTLSFRRVLLSRLLPLPLESDWRIRADDVLVYGASLLLGRKYFLAAKHVRYHIHDGNHWFGKEMDELAKWRHDVALTRLIRHLAGPALDQHRGWHSLILREFTLLPRRLPDDTASSERSSPRFSRRCKAGYRAPELGS